MTAPVTTSAFDPRVRVRDALRELIAEDPHGWYKPSYFVLRNRLLDRTGSDARPYAELLLEAARRGWRERLPRTMLDPQRWHATVAPFQLHWSAERFLQPEMARWALESWAYALKVIDASQLTVAPPPREPMQTVAARLNAGAARAATATAPSVGFAPSAGAAAGPAPRPRVVGSRTTGTPATGTSTAGMAAAAAGGRAAARTASRGTIALPPRQTTAYGARGRPAAPPVPAWVTKAMAGTLTLMALAVVGRVAFFSTPAGAEGAPSADAYVAAGEAPATRVSSLDSALAATRAAAKATSSPATSPPISPVAQAMRTPVDTTITTPTIAPPPMTAASPGSFAAPMAPSAMAPLKPGQLVSPTLTGGVAVVATEKPGVPAVTKAVLPSAADSSRMIFVQPARRAAGESRVVTAAPGRAPLTYDELHLRNGQILRGRVDVVQAGSVIFRDQKTGLRYEIRKDEIDEIISEFGTPVRFRAAGAATTPERESVRFKGVGGRYRVRYEAATAVGSPECVQVWTRPPQAQDIALVKHRPGADTLSIAFEGGDNFPSNIDGEGWFASTFRIVPDQARTMTALTTRLNGRFLPNGTLQFAVNIVFFRRMRTGADVTCNVTVNAEGRRE